LNVLKPVQILPNAMETIDNEITVFIIYDSLELINVYLVILWIWSDLNEIVYYRNLHEIKNFIVKFV